MLFHYIETTVSKKKTKTTEEIIIGVNNSNLIVIGVNNSNLIVILVNNSNLIAVKKKALSMKFFTIAHVNARLIRNKAPQVQLEISTRGIDVCASQKH